MNCCSPCPPPPALAWWAGEMGPSPAAEDLFILHSIKGNQALSDIFGLEGAGREEVLNLKSKPDQLLPELLLWVLNGLHCANQVCWSTKYEPPFLTDCLSSPPYTINYSDLFLPPNHANAPQMAFPSSLLVLSCPTLPPANLALSLLQSLFPSPAPARVDSGFFLTINWRVSFVLEMCHLPSALSLSADHSAARGGPGVLRTHGISVQNVFFTLCPQPWSQSMTFTGGIQSGHLSDSLVGKWKWHRPNLLFPQQGGRSAVFSLDQAAEGGGMGERGGKETLEIA